MPGERWQDRPWVKHRPGAEQVSQMAPFPVSSQQQVPPRRPPAGEAAPTTTSEQPAGEDRRDG